KPLTPIGSGCLVAQSFSIRSLRVLSLATSLLTSRSSKSLRNNYPAPILIRIARYGFPKWRPALQLTLRRKDRLELCFERRGHGQAFDDHFVQGSPGDRI